jgi:hypothetical protein
MHIGGTPELCPSRELGIILLGPCRALRLIGGQLFQLGECHVGRVELVDARRLNSLDLAAAALWAVSPPLVRSPLIHQLEVLRVVIAKPMGWTYGLSGALSQPSPAAFLARTLEEPIHGGSPTQ